MLTDSCWVEALRLSNLKTSAVSVSVRASYVSCDGGSTACRATVLVPARGTATVSPSGEAWDLCLSNILLTLKLINILPEYRM